MRGTPPPLLNAAALHDLRLGPRFGQRLEHAKALGVKMGRPPKLAGRPKKGAFERRDSGEETLAEIGKSYNVSGWTIVRL